MTLPRSRNLAANGAPGKVKNEHGDRPPLARPAKRRKTLGCTKEFRFEPETPSGRAGAPVAAKIPRGGGAGRRGRGRGGAGRRGRKNNTLYITPIVQPSSPVLVPVQSSPRAKKRYEAPRIGTDCRWPDKVVATDEASRREVRPQCPSFGAPVRSLMNRRCAQFVQCDK